MSSPAADAEDPLSYSEWLEQQNVVFDPWKQALDDLANPGLRIRAGSTVPLSYARQHARRLFVSTLHRLLPSLTDSLVSADGIALQNQSDGASAAINAFAEALAQSNSDGRVQPHPAEILRALVQDRALASAALAEHIDGWQKRYHLTDEWVRRAAGVTLSISAYFEKKGTDIDAPSPLLVDAPFPLLVIDPGATQHEGRVRSMADIPDLLSAMVSSRHDFTVAPVYIDDLKWSFLPPEDIERSNGGFLAGFDPRTESIEYGVKRILPALESRLRRALEHIAREDCLANGAQTIPQFRKWNAFEWLVRYQVLGQSRAEIARNEKVERTNVGREIRRVADLVGITLRQSKGGRPQRTHAHTISKPVR